jgi:hypothetical protein
MTTSSSCNDKETAVAPNPHGSGHIEFPNDLEIVLTRDFNGS